MAEATLKDLNYGHFGEPRYDLENRAWTFGREPGRKDVLRQVGFWKTALPPAKTLDNATPPDHVQPIRATQRAAKFLAHDNPPLVPSLKYLPENAQVSAAATSIAETYDPLVGNLLTFGFASTRTRQKQSFNRRTRKVAALPSGEGGNILRVVALGTTRLGWGTDRSIWVEGSSIGDEESGYWVESAAPIQQVCYAEADNRYPFLAARLREKTVLFRPSLHNLPVAPARSPLYSLPPSRIEVNPIASISIAQTGNVPHADVAFNSYYQRQVGLVDQQGGWSLWDIEGSGRYDAPYSVSCTARGSINVGADHVPASPTEEDRTKIEDGWARLLWVGDVNTLVVCDRRKLAVLDTRSDPPMRLKCSEVLSPQSPDWILDVKRHPTNRHHFFVLTSSRLSLMAITCVNEATPGNDEDMGARIAFSWTHFRGPDDITLQLNVSSTSNTDSIGSLVVLYSRLNALVTMYRFGAEIPQQSSTLTSSDPTSLTFEDEHSSTGPGRHINSIHFNDLRFEVREDRKRRQPGPGSSYMAKGTSFYRLSALLSDLSVSEALLYSSPADNPGAKVSPLYVELPSWDKTTHPPLGFDTAAEIVDSDDDFVVADGLDTTTVPQPRWHGRASKLRSRSHQDRLSSTRLGGNTRLENYLGIYESVIHPALASEHLEGEATDGIDIADVVARMKKVLLRDGEDHDDIPLETLLEQTDAKLRVADIDASSAELRDILASASEPDSVQLQHIAHPEIVNPAATSAEEATIASVYDAILQIWIGSLPPNIPARVRQTKERLARRIAADVALAGIRLRRADAPKTHGDSAALHERVTPTSDSFPIPPSSQPSSPWSPSSPPTFSQPPSQIALPTPEPTPSVASDPLGPSTVLPTMNPIARLSQHLRITKPAAAIPPGVSGILKHWQLGADPNAYNWETTTSTVQEELGEGEQLTPSERERRQRKAERHLKRQKKEAETNSAREAESRRMVESQPVGGARDGGFRSSPPPRIGVGMSSQVPSQSQMPPLGGFPVMSQVEPGRHGGRPTKKKPKRMGGF
ncbi:RNA polymerase I-specific transcription initiation factor RRN6-like protein [Lophiotrema nucula]|uniref:RNA polymerase I-specific transcription initiation factor RRN6-like protein n=1 Tax=Lophiotrema nucula TaxID=690887 RepID=A0A6A5ZS58_9PLEO|nr:RNA polymerase I-specific transcription initiation factor RRN6-like protein [Lophiotrema nucula]